MFPLVFAIILIFAGYYYYFFTEKKMETKTIQKLMDDKKVTNKSSYTRGDIEDMRPGCSKVSDDLLEKMVCDILDLNPQTQKECDNLIKNFQKKKKRHTDTNCYGTVACKSELYRVYRDKCAKEGKVCDQKILTFLQKFPVRGESGVQVVAVTLSPYPNGQKFTCQWNCKYCPDQPGQPRSYLKEEPGVLRANKCNFDPVLQMYDRLTSYDRTGHQTDKLEIIVLGGTWASYPDKYQNEFITGLYYGANTFYDDEKRNTLTLEEEIKINETAKCRIIGLTLETRPDCINPKELIKFRKMGVTRIQMGVQHINDRILDRINRQCTTIQTIEAIKMLKDNCFKVDIHLMPDLPRPLRMGVESKEYDDAFDELVATFGDVFDYVAINFKNYMIEYEDMIAVTDDKIVLINMEKFEMKLSALSDESEKNKLLCFKSYIDCFNLIDWNFDMYEEDKKMFDTVISSPQFQADQWKVYPFQVTPYSRMLEEFKMGFHKSYVENKTENGNKLIDILLYIKEKVPEWIRINRIVRDIPSQYIKGGCESPNLNQYLIDSLRKKEKMCRDIRSRAVGSNVCDLSKAKFCVRKFAASEGTEYFLSYESDDEKLLYGFIRLRITDTPGIAVTTGARNGQVVFDELQGCALIRELHVYGKTIAVSGTSASDSSQHVGFGTKLLQAAEEIAKENGFNKIAVISGVGVREYYKKRGYTSVHHFEIKDI